MTIQTELEAIAKADPNGVLRPSDTVAWAKRNKTSELHEELFNKNDAEAAYEYRLNKARSLIRTHYIVVKDRGDGKPVEMRGFVIEPVPEGGGERGYAETEEVISQPVSRERVLRDILKRLRSIIASYPMPELDPITKAIDKVEASL